MTRIGAFGALLLACVVLIASPNSSFGLLDGDSNNPAIFSATFELAQAVPTPAVEPQGTTGAGVFSFDPETRILTFQISLINLTSSIRALQFHIGAAGEAGAPIQTICGEGPAGVIGTPLVDGPCREGVNHTMQQSWQLTADQAAELFAERIYVNVHTETNFAPGEIRGQLRRLNP